MIKKQIGLLTIIAVLVSFMAFTGVASAKTDNVQVVFFTSPFCSACATAHPIVESAAAKYGVTLVTYDVTTGAGKGIATANGVSTTPTIIVSGAQSARFEGSITQAQIESAIQAAIGNPTPAPTKTVVKATTTPKETVKATTTPKVVAATTTPKVVAATTTPKVIVAATAQPTIVVATATPTTTNSTQTVPEFSLLGLGAPALLVGAIYLFLRRR